ncbi:hypothetical protein Tco_0662628 [Tanacetum coccineum]
MKRGFQGIHRPLLPVMLTIDAGQPQPSAAPTPSHPVPTPTSSHVQITQSPTPPPPSTLTQPVQSSSTPPQPSSVQPTATTPPPPITSSPPVSTIPDIQPTLPPSPQIPSPSYHDTEGPSFEPSYHLSPPPSHEPENQAFRSSEESEQLRNLMDIVPRLQSRVESLEKELSETKQTLGTAILQLIEKVKKLENKLRKKRKSKEAKDAEGQDQEVPFETDQGDTFATPEKSKGSGEAQEEQISPSTLEAAQILTNVASEGFKGSQAPLGSKIYKRKPKSTKTPTKILHFEEPDSAQVNTAQVNTAELNPDSTPSAQVNTGEVNAAEVNTGEAERVQRRKGKEPMTEEDLQAEVQASKTSKELQELADLEEAQRLQAKMDAETQRQIDLDALLLETDQIRAEKLHKRKGSIFYWKIEKDFSNDTIAAQRKEDLKIIYELVMEEYKDRLPEGFDRMLWGDLMIMFNQGDTADFWDTQQDWNLISWKLHSSSGVHTIMTSAGLVFHMLVESRYPLTKEVLSQMLELKLETEEESSMALELIKFVKQQLEEFEDSNDDDLVTSDHGEEERV